MKILVFGDTHTDIDTLLTIFEKSKDVDIVIFLGDLTYFGEGMELVELIAQIPKKVIMMHGNHEAKEDMKEACEPYENLHFSDKEIIAIDDFDILTYGGGGFEYIDEEFELFIKEAKKQIRNNKKTILLFHAPPFNTKIDIPFEDHHAGSMSFRDAIETIQPLASFAGHIHEGEEKYDLIGETIIHNPGPMGTIIDLEELHNHRLEDKIKQFLEKIEKKK